MGLAGWSFVSVTQLTFFWNFSWKDFLSKTTKVVSWNLLERVVGFTRGVSSVVTHTAQNLTQRCARHWRRGGMGSSATTKSWSVFAIIVSDLMLVRNSDTRGVGGWGGGGGGGPFQNGANLDSHSPSKLCKHASRESPRSWLVSTMGVSLGRCTRCDLLFCKAFFYCSWSHRPMPPTAAFTTSASVGLIVARLPVGGMVPRVEGKRQLNLAFLISPANAGAA